MARIRSIKPEFFTSETLARVPLSARLTFIGLWTYVDDNGVGLDNERLIDAALYPLDEDPLESLRRVSEDLRQLSAVGVITRYVIAGRRYLHVTNWEEHQKVSHPGKPRYPLPLNGTPISQNGSSPEHLPSDSGNPPEDVGRSSALSREQGAGSREQGSGAGNASADADGAVAAGAKRRSDPMARFPEFWAIYPLKKGKAAAEKNWAKVVKDGADPQAIIDGALAYALECRTKEPDKIKYPQGWLTDGRWMDEPAPTLPGLGVPGSAIPAPALVRPPWCGQCNERTRMVDDTDQPYHCPECGPYSPKQKASTT